MRDTGVACLLVGMPELLTIGEVSRRSGVAASALRFYEERGLISSERAGSGHRRYPRPVLRRIAFIVFAQRIGLSLDEIGAELAKLPPDRAPTRRDWSRLSSSWTAGSTSASPSCSGSSTGSRSASGAAACRSTAASWPIPATAPPGWAPGRGIGSATARRPDGSPCNSFASAVAYSRSESAARAPGLPDLNGRGVADRCAAHRRDLRRQPVSHRRPVRPARRRRSDRRLVRQQRRHLLNRRLNSALHKIAIVQPRAPAPPRPRGLPASPRWSW